MTTPSNERRAFETDTHARIMDIESQLDRGDERMERIETDVAVMKGQVAEVYEILSAAKGFFKVLGWIGKAVKWAVGVGTAFIALWALFKR